VIFVGAVPEWEGKNHFCTEVAQKAVIRKIIRSRRFLPLGKNSVAKPDFCFGREDNGNIFNGVENSRRSLENSETGGVEKVRKWHMGCGEAGHCGICFDKAG
jgi:hypothetical protein